MSTKNCFKCNLEKKLEDFYKHPQMPDGRVNKCKECNTQEDAPNLETASIYYSSFNVTDLTPP